MNYKPTRLKFVVGGNKKYFGAVFNFSEVRDRYKSMNEVSPLLGMARAQFVFASS